MPRENDQTVMMGPPILLESGRTLARWNEDSGILIESGNFARSWFGARGIGDSITLLVASEMALTIATKSTGHAFLQQQARQASGRRERLP